MIKSKEIPSVAIRCLVYNHEKYLSNCLDGIVMQKTNFPYFAVVHDDHSNDRSVEIIKEYQRKYPDKIVAIFEEQNCYSTDWRIADRKIVNAYGNAKYIATCEGDDYWTDSYKLQKQVDFMESHQDYAVCAHETVIMDEQYNNEDVLYSTVVVKNSSIIPTTRTNYSFEDTLRGNIFHLSSILYRHKDLIEFPQWRYRISAGDMVLFRYLGSCGKTHWMPDVMSVYRGHAGSITNTEIVYNSAVRFNLLNIKVMRLLNRFWCRKYQMYIYPIIAQYYADNAWLYTKKSMRDFAQCRSMMKLACRYNKCSALRYVAKKIIDRLSLVFKKK